MAGCCTPKKTHAPDDASPYGSGKRFKDFAEKII